MKSIIDYTNKLKDFFAQKQALTDEQNIYGAKNILDFSKLAVVNPFVQNKITYTFHQDTGIINIVSDGTSTGSSSPYCYLPIYSENTDVIVSVEGIDSSKNDYLVYDYTASSTLINGTTEKTTTLPANHLMGITIRSYSNKTYNETIKLMVRRCGDSTFVPFAKGNIELTKDDSGLAANAYLNGAVNLLENIGSSQVVGGVTFIVSADKTITTNGASLYSNDYSTLTVGSVTKIKVGERYKLTGCPSGGGIQKYHMYFVARDSSNAFIEYWQETGEGINITIPSGTVKIDAYVRCYYDVNVNGKVFKPMITVADMPNSDYNHYVPYRMSNGELTQDLTVNSVDVSAIFTGTSIDTNKSKANGDYVSLVLKAVLPQVDYEGEYLLRAASNGRPKTESAWGFGVRISDNTAHRFYENTDGYICNTAAITAGTYYIFLNYFK